MSNSQIAEELSRLLALEVDAVQAYSAALALVAPGALHDELAVFGLEHQRHAVELHDHMLKLGHRPPAVTPDVKGVVIGALTPPRRRPTLEELLEAMRGNEQLTNAVFAKVLAKPLPPDARAFLAGMRDEERRHLDWVERTLSRRPWESASQTQP